MQLDFETSDHGSVVLLTPHTEAAREWAGEYLPDDAPRFGHAYAVEHRYIDDIVAGIQSDGLTVN